jgi:hypothetical protein
MRCCAINLLLCGCSTSAFLQPGEDATSDAIPTASQKKTLDWAIRVSYELATTAIAILPTKDVARYIMSDTALPTCPTIELDADQESIRQTLAYGSGCQTGAFGVLRGNVVGSVRPELSTFDLELSELATAGHPSIHGSLRGGFDTRANLSAFAINATITSANGTTTNGNAAWEVDHTSNVVSILEAVFHSTDPVTRVSIENATFTATAGSTAIFLSKVRSRLPTLPIRPVQPRY